jgi:hypothetical protein
MADGVQMPRHQNRIGRRRGRSDTRNGAHPSGEAVTAIPEALVEYEPLDPLAIPKYPHDLTSRVVHPRSFATPAEGCPP